MTVYNGTAIFFATYLLESINLSVTLRCFSFEAVCAGRRKSLGLCQILAKVNASHCGIIFSPLSLGFVFVYIAACCFWLRLWLFLYSISTVGSNVNGPVTSGMSGNPHNEPLPSHESQQKGRVQRSKSFPWDGPPRFELPQSTMSSFEEKDKESPIEVFIIS